MTRPAKDKDHPLPLAWVPLIHNIPLIFAFCFQLEQNQGVVLFVWTIRENRRGWVAGSDTASANPLGSECEQLSVSNNITGGQRRR